MASVKCSDITSALTKKGFRKVRSSKHDFYYFYVKDKRTSIHTHMSHGEYEIYDDNIKKMYLQMKLDKKQFLSFVSCEFADV